MIRGAFVFGVGGTIGAIVGFLAGATAGVGLIVYVLEYDKKIEENKIKEIKL